MKSSSPNDPQALVTAAGKLVLIEDDPMDRLLVREILADGAAVGMEMADADTAKAGLALVDAKTTIVLIDNMLPDGYGLDLVARLRAAWPDLAIIMMTGTGDEQIAVEALKRGANDYLPKPKMSPGTLHRAIHDAVDRIQLARLMRQKQAQLALISELTDTTEDLQFVIDVRREAIVMGNAATRRALGRPEADLGEEPAPVAHLFKAGDASWQALRALLGRQSPARFETTIWAGAYVGRPFEISARLMNQEGRQFVVGIGRDITERRNLQADLLQHAALDPQTDLPTVSAFLLQMEGLARADADGARGWLLAAVSVGALEAVTRDISPETLADWRLRIARLLVEAANRQDGCVGVHSTKTFLLALPVENQIAAKDQLETLQRQMVEAMKDLPKATQVMATRHLSTGRVAFGGLFGAPTVLATKLQVEKAAALAAEAELAGRQMLVRA